jgi:hypothetical protein
MKYIYESIFVGIYVCFIYLLFSPFFKNFYVLLLISGFFKHLLGSIFGIWNWYCNNGNACMKVLSKYQKYEANTLYLISDSLYESIIFLVAGTILATILKNRLLLFFIMGIILHIISEMTGIHKSFCIKTCDKKVNKEIKP